MIGEIDRNTLRALVQREGVGQVLLVLAEVVQSLPVGQLAGGEDAAMQRRYAGTPASRDPMPRIVSAKPPSKPKAITERPQPGPTRIVSANPPRRSK